MVLRVYSYMSGFRSTRPSVSSCLCDASDQLFDVRRKDLECLLLHADELAPDELSRPLPCWPVLRENTLAEQRETG